MIDAHQLVHRRGGRLWRGCVDDLKPDVKLESAARFRNAERRAHTRQLLCASRSLRTGKRVDGAKDEVMVLIGLRLRARRGQEDEGDQRERPRSHPARISI